MQRLKDLIKKYFSNFVWFYRYLGNRIFIAFFLSISVSVLDGLGLTMFLPLLKLVDKGGNVNSDEIGNLSIIIETLEKTGISLTVLSVLITMILFFVLKGAAVYFQKVYQVYLQQGFIRKIRLNLLRNLNQIKFKSFIASDVGRIQNTMTGEVLKVNQAFTTYMNTFQQGVMVAVYLVFAVFADSQFAVLVCIGGLTTNFLYRMIYSRTKAASRALTMYDNFLQGQIIQHTAHFKYLKTTGGISNYSEKIEETIYKVEKQRKKIGFLNSISSAIREPILVIIIAIIIFIQINYFNGVMGTILISLLFFYRALTSLMTLQESWNIFMSNVGSLENMQSFQDELVYHREKDGKFDFGRFEKEIQLEHLGFSFGKTGILKDINLSIRKNQSIAFVGESGSGKTTLVNLICGLLSETEGRIRIDDVLIKSLKKKTYQQRIGYVSQDAVIFNDSIFNNVTFFAPKTEENLTRFQKVIKQAALDSFIDHLPNGKNTMLGNNGINLSGGQKQRISIARELYKEIDILILDEATSALDSETEKTIQESIEALQGSYTLIMIAHRLSTIKNVDKIVLMDKGQILEIDSFDNLVSKQERFRKMVELQEL